MELTPLQPWIANKIGCSPPALTRPALEAYQLERLRDTLDWVRQKSPFYRRRLASAPPRLDHLSDLARLPFTTAQDLRNSGAQMVCVSQGEISRIVTLHTSGASGEPKRCFFTPSDQELTIDFFGVGMQVLVSPGDRVLILLPGERPGSVGDLLRIALERTGVSAIPHGPADDPLETLRLMSTQQVTCLVANPVQALILARLGPDAGGCLRSILLTTDHVPASLAQAIRDTWGCEVHNHYGMTEMGLGGGVSCAAQTGYHLREADLYFEVIDPQSGQPLPDGESGEVVFTTLTRRGMPLIRYRTGDLGRFLPAPCPCGSLLKSLDWIRTRMSGLIDTPGGPLCLADLDEALFAIPEVYTFTAALCSVSGRLDLELRVYARDTEPALDQAIHAALAQVPALASAASQQRLDLNLILEAALPPDLGSLRKRSLLRVSR